MKTRVIPLNWVLSFLAVLGMTGCMLMSRGDKKSAEVAIYSLRPPPAREGVSPAPVDRSVVVLVSKPELPKGFETERITLLFEQEHRIEYYAGAKWSAPLEDLLQDYMVQMARQVAPDKLVPTTDTTLAARHKLVVKVSDFQPVYQGTAESLPRLDVAITVLVVGQPGDRVEAQFSLKRSAPASANRLGIVVQELEGLWREVARETMEKLLATAEERAKSN
jgi:ABC-type uncharacterized transport system auxiliary subunit